MNRFATLAALLLVLLVPACSQRGFYTNLNIEARPVPGVDFSSYKTWKFAHADEYLHTGYPVLDDPKFRNAISDHTIAEMQKLGYKYVDQDPDFVLMVHVVVENKFDEQKMNNITQGFDMAWAQMSDKDYWNEGTLMMFVMDAKTGKQVWSSVAQAHLDDKSNYDTKKKRFMKVISMMLEDFPKHPGT